VVLVAAVRVAVLVVREHLDKVMPVARVLLAAANMAVVAEVAQARLALLVVALLAVMVVQAQHLH
jgi:hypothetical protein